MKNQILISTLIVALTVIADAAPTAVTHKPEANPVQPVSFKPRKADQEFLGHTHKMKTNTKAAADAEPTVVPGVDILPIEVVQQSTAATDVGHRMLVKGELGSAEANFRQALNLNSTNSAALSGLAETLERQGKNQEAIQVYRALLYPKHGWHTSLEDDPILRMHLTLLLIGDEQWPEAVHIYESTIRNVNLGHSYSGYPYPALNVHFRPDNPQPQLLAAMAYLVLGIEHSHRAEEYTEALSKYAEAVRLQPNLALANFYYGYGLRRLGLTDQAKDAFGIAERIGSEEIQAAAREEIKHLP